MKNGTYNPDSFPNPCECALRSSLPISNVTLLNLVLLSIALAFHNAQLEASAFREEYDPETFEDKTEPVHDRIHQVRFDSIHMIFPLAVPIVPLLENRALT